MIQSDNLTVNYPIPNESGVDMSLRANERNKLNQIIERIQTGHFNENDVDSLLIKLRAYSRDKKVFSEVAHFVAHPDARDQGTALNSITAFIDSYRFYLEYSYPKRELDLSAPFPAYLYRLFISQTQLVDESRLKAEHKMNRASLINKIKNSFSVNKPANTCCLQKNKGGVALFAALSFVTSIIYSRPVFHIRDFHKELKEIMHAQKIQFNETEWDAQADRISLAILCLIANTEFDLGNGDRVKCNLGTEHHFRLISGQRRLPLGTMSSEPMSFGSLMIQASTTLTCLENAPITVVFPLIETELDPHAHCHPELFIQRSFSEDFGDRIEESINFAPDMSLTDDFKLVQTKYT